MQIVMDQALKELKAHPFTLVVIIALAVFSWYAYHNFARASDVTEIKSDIDFQAKINTCRWLSDKIETHENSIYVLERDGGNREWINEKKQELSKLKQRYTATTCSTTGY